MTARRILYVQYTNPAGYPPLEHSSRILADRGWQVMFLGTGAHGANTLELPAHANIEVRRWKFQHPGFRQKLHYLAFNFWVLITALRWKPKWIYASDILACPIALVLKRIGFRVLYHEHDSPNPEVPPSPSFGAAGRGRRSDVSGLSSVVRGRWSAFQWFLLWTRKKLARCADLCVLPNKRRVEFFKQQTATSRPVICVWNCPSRDEAIVQPEKTADELILFYHGSIVPDRLPVSVIYALANLPSSVRLRIAGYETVGHPGYVRELEEFADSRELGSRFEYLGSLSSRQALLRETGKAHVGLALMPIKAMDLNLQAMTGASNKPFEYMACGLALLVSDLPDWSEMFVDPGFARACDPRRPENITEAVRWFVENPVKTRNMGERGRKQVLDEWNYETQFEAVSRALESM
jgi:glycosyltransferase involved in cell wall biosynthesis